MSGMGADYVLVLEPEAEFRRCGGWGSFPKAHAHHSSARVQEILRACPFLRSEGATFWTDWLEPFEVEPGEIPSLFFATHGLSTKPLEDMIRVAIAIARSLGPITLFDGGTDERVNVTADMTVEEACGGFHAP